MKKINLRFGLTYCPETGVIYNNDKKAGNIRKPKLYVHIRNKNIKTKSKTISAHRLIWTSLYGKIPKNFTIDHLNGIPYDNRISNLRCIPILENYKNRSTPKNNTSGSIGVSFHKASQKWRARIQFNLKEKHLGLFNTREEAVEVWLKEKKALGYHENHGRKSIYV